MNVITGSSVTTATTKKPISRFRFATKRRTSFFGSTSTLRPKVTTAPSEEADQTLESSNQTSREEDPLNTTQELTQITDVLQELQQATIGTQSSTRSLLDRGGWFYIINK